MYKIRELPEKYENIILPLLSINSKLSLGGSLALYILGIMDCDFSKRRADIDISLSEPLTEEELLIIKDFFDLSFLVGKGDYDVIIEPPRPISDIPQEVKLEQKSASHFLGKELIQLKNDFIKIDIFNREYMTNIFDTFYLRYKEDYEIKITFPSIILSYKYRYAINPWVGSNQKHLNDLSNINFNKLSNILGNIKFYFEYGLFNNDIKRKYVWWDEYWDKKDKKRNKSFEIDNRLGF